MLMWTHPVESGTSCSVHEPPWSVDTHTLLVSWSPTHFAPGTRTQVKVGSTHAPEGSTTGGCRTKTPPRSVSSRVRAGPHVAPSSSDVRARTKEVSWSPAC